MPRPFQKSQSAFCVRKFIFALILFFAFGFLNFLPHAEALKVRAHPIRDLIEGDERVPPQGEHIVEERPATPAYPLPNTTKFSRQTAVETFPQIAKKEDQAGVSPEGGDEWADWSSWDETSKKDEWDSWGEDQNSQSTDGWDSWDKESAGQQTDAGQAVGGDDKRNISEEAPMSSDELSQDSWSNEENLDNESSTPFVPSPVSAPKTVSTSVPAPSLVSSEANFSGSDNLVSSSDQTNQANISKS